MAVLKAVTSATQRVLMGLGELVFTRFYCARLTGCVRWGVCARDRAPPKEERMPDTTVTKVNSHYSPKGKLGQKYLASGKSMAMRMWDGEAPGEAGDMHVRPYETLGYVIAGRAELSVEGSTVLLEAGDSWVVPEGARHAYKILEPFTAIEATHPPAQVHGRDE